MRYTPVPNEVYHIEQQMQAQLTRRCAPQEPPAVGEQYITRIMNVDVTRNCERRVQSCAISSTQNHRDEKKQDKGVASYRRHSAHNRPQCGRFTGDISDIITMAEIRKRGHSRTNSACSKALRRCL